MVNRFGMATVITRLHIVVNKVMHAQPVKLSFDQVEGLVLTWMTCSWVIMFGLKNLESNVFVV